MSSRHWTAIDGATEAACLSAAAAVHAEAERLLLVVDEAHTTVRAVIHPAAAALRGNPPTLTLGAMRDRLGFTVTADFLAELGFEATPVKAARLYRECEFGNICRAISGRALVVGGEYELVGM